MLARESTEGGLTMKLPDALGPLEEAQQLFRTEAQRAIALFPTDEGEAICEVIRRSNKIPDLRRVLLVHSALIAVGEAQDTVRVMFRRED
jgi:uncharacterized protein YjbK